MRPQRQQERHRHGVQHRPTARSSVKPFASPCPPHLFVKMEQHGKHAAARKHAAATCEQHTATWKAYGSNMRAACSNMEGIRQQHASSMRQHGRQTAATCKQHAASNMEGIRQQHASSMQQHGRHTATTCEQHAASMEGIQRTGSLIGLIYKRRTSLIYDTVYHGKRTGSNQVH